MELDFKYQVVTRCFTYNHAPFIVDAMNGFTMQETTFPVMTCIIDDASTDGEAGIICQYLTDYFQNPYQEEDTDDYHLICATHKINKNCMFVVFLLKYNHYSIKKDKFPYIEEWLDNAKYHAICEGDDNWINPHKLQMQYDMLEKHPEYSLCSHNAIKWYVNEKTVRMFNEGIHEGVLSPSSVIDKWIIPTASMFLRKSFTAYPDWMVHIYSGDMALYLRCLAAGDIYYFDDIMSVYRINTIGTSATASLKGRESFIKEQQIILLDSFNKGTNYKFSREIKKKIKKNKQIIRYNNLSKKGFWGKILYCFEPLLYQRITEKVNRVFHMCFV